jgi:hypothetical protein
MRQAINDVVQWVTTKLQKGERVDVAFVVREITHSQSIWSWSKTRSIKDRCSLTSWVA